MRLYPVIAILACVTTAASAQDAQDYSDSKSPSNGFTGLRGSLAFDNRIGVHAATKTASASGKVNADVGGGASLYWGWRLPYGFKTELELLYRNQSLSDGSVNGVGGKIGGYTQTFAPMLNAYWNLPVGDIGIHPFIGAGLGYAWNEAGINNIAGASFPTLHDDKWRFAYNAMAGLSVPLSDGSRLTGMYRWFHEDIDIPCAGLGFKCGANYNSSSVDMGLELDL